MTLTAAEVFRNYAVDGVPASGVHQPDKADIREWGETLEIFATATQTNIGSIFPTRALLYANLAFPANAMAWVLGDAIPGNNGIYRKIGASGVGSWTWVADLPFAIVNAIDVGAGTANAIIATSALPVSSSALVRLNIFEANTGSPVTVAFNGESPLTIKTNSGNDVVNGGLVSGAIVLGFRSGSTFRLLSDQASAAVQAACEAALAGAQAARVGSEAARDLAIEASDLAATVGAGDVPTCPSITLAKLSAFPATRTYLIVAGYTTHGDAPLATYKRVSAQPSHQGRFRSTDRFLPNGTTDSSNGGWWEITEQNLRPEHFGKLGVDAAGDTAAWTALVSVANARGGKIQVQVRDDLKLLGTGVSNDSQTFNNFTEIWLRGYGSPSIFQQNILSKSLKFVGYGKVKVTGFRAVGRAQIRIDAAQSPLDEINLDASSGNAVAAINAEGCSEVVVRRLTTQNHAGRDIICRGVMKLRVDASELVGLGPLYNDPIRDGHQGNGEDSAIYHIPTDYTLAGTAWKQTLEVYNSTIKWHSFGIRTTLNGSMRLHGNIFDETPGQYHVYDTESDDVSVVGNTFKKARVASTKWQFENYAGITYGPAYDANKPMYNVGDIVRAFSTSYINKTAYAPGGAAFSSTNWNVYSRYRRSGYLFSGNIWADNGGAAVAIVSSESAAVNGLNIWNSGLIFTGNSIRNSGAGEMLRLDRCVSAKVSGNTLVNGNYGIIGRYFSGTISDNDIRLADKNAIVLSLAEDTVFDNNRYWDCGLGGTADDSRSPVFITTLDVNAPPTRKPNPIVMLNRNGWLYTGGEGGASTALDSPGQYYLLDADPRNWWRIDTTYGTGARAKKFRIDGNVISRRMLHFRAGFANTAQNKPLWTIGSPATNRNLPAAASLANAVQCLQTLIHEDMYEDDLTNAP